MSSEWVTVPREPTEMMLEAADAVADAWPYGHTIASSEMCEAIKAALSAAPSPDRAESVERVRREEIKAAIREAHSIGDAADALFSAAH